MSIFNTSGFNYLPPQAPCWDAANVDFYWDADVSYKAEPTNYIPAAAFEGNNFKHNIDVFTDTPDFKRLQSYNNFRGWINVYFLRGLKPGVNPVNGATIISDGKDRRAIVIADRVTTTVDVARTVAHELGHAFGLVHTEGDRGLFGQDVLKARINNPIFVAPPEDDAEWHNLMFFGGTLSNAHLTEFQCWRGHKGARAHPSLRLTD